jgi:hypothetical protein
MAVELSGIHFEPGSSTRRNKAANDSFFLSNRPKWVSPGSLVVSGSQGSLRGVIYGVYDLLRRMGCSFLAFDQSMAEELPATAPIGFPLSPPGQGNNLDLMVRPSFVFRDAMHWPVIGSSSHAQMAAKLGYNGKYAHADLPSNISVGQHYAGDGHGGQYFAHTAYKLLGPDRRNPPPDLWAKHREWFWPREDNNTYGQLCWTNRSLISFVTNRVLSILRADSTANLISISQNDNANFCQDKHELAIIEQEGSPSGPLLRGVNQIASSIHAEFPNVMVETLAYEWSQPPPRITRPGDNVLVQLSTIFADFGQALSDPSNSASIDNDLMGWAAISNRSSLAIWDYSTNFASFLTPFPSWSVIGQNVKHYHQHGVSTVFSEGSYNSPGGDMARLQAYVLGRMLFDASLNSQRLIDEFVHGYFGQRAAPFIRLYMDIFKGAIFDGVGTGSPKYQTSTGTVWVATNQYVGGMPSDAAFLSPIAMLTAGASMQRPSPTRTDNSSRTILFPYLTR